MRPRSKALLLTAPVTLAIAWATIGAGSDTVDAQPDRPVFALLAAAGQQPADLLPDRRVSIAHLTTHMPQLIPQTARLVAATPDRSFALIQRTDRQTCLVSSAADGSAADGSGGIACLPDGIAARQGLAFTGPGAGVGVAPDGVTTIAFTLTDATTQNVPVGDRGLYRAPKEAVSATMLVNETPSTREFTPASALPPGAVPDATGKVHVRQPTR